MLKIQRERNKRVETRLNKKEIINHVKTRKIEKKAAIVLISDFLVKTREEAKKIYEEEFEGNI